MKKASNKDYAIALYDVTQNLKGRDLTQALTNFTELLAKHRVLKQADKIINEFVRYARCEEGIKDISVTSCRALAKTILQEIKKVFGDKVEATENINPGILGGIIIRTEDTIFDASLKTQLLKLKQVMS